MKLAAMTGARIALQSVFPAVALVGGASEAGHSISRSVVMVVGSDKTVCSGVVIARDLVLTAAQCISPATRHGIIGFDAPRTLKIYGRPTSTHVTHGNVTTGGGLTTIRNGNHMRTYGANGRLIGTGIKRGNRVFTYDRNGPTATAGARQYDRKGRHIGSTARTN